MLETQHVYTLVQRFHEHKSGLAPVTGNDPNQAWPCQAWPLTVGALDWFARSLASTVMDYAAGGWQQAPIGPGYALNRPRAGLHRERPYRRHGTVPGARDTYSTRCARLHSELRA